MAIDRSAVREQMRRAKTVLLSANAFGSFHDLIYADRTAFTGLRVLYASDAAGVPIQGMLSNDGNVQSIFTGKGLLAFSSEIEAAMQSGEAAIGIGVRPLIDTNLFSDLPKLLTGEDFSTRERVETSLDYLTLTFGPGLLDWTFSSLENMREAAKPHNRWPIRKSAAARHYLAYGRSKLSGDQFREFMPLAEGQWQDWLKSDAMWHQVRRRDAVYIVMLLAFMEAWNGSQPVGALRRMIKFCLDCLGSVPLKELYFGWKILCGIHRRELALDLFSEPSLKQPKSDSLARINAVAWDLFLFRWCETQMTERPQLDRRLNVFGFYVPAVTTLDEGLLSAIRSCPLKALLVHDEAQVVESLFADELQFQVDLNEAMTADISSCLMDPKRLASTGRVNHTAQEMAVQVLEAQVRTMIGSKPS